MRRTFTFVRSLFAPLSRWLYRPMLTLHQPGLSNLLHPGPIGGDFCVHSDQAHPLDLGLPRKDAVGVKARQCQDGGDCR